MESGHRGNLSVAQNRALLLLWKRFIDACEGGPNGYRPQPTASHPRASSHTQHHANAAAAAASATAKNNSHDYFANANGTTARLSHSYANGHHYNKSHLEQSADATFGYSASAAAAGDGTGNGNGNGAAAAAAAATHGRRKDGHAQHDEHYFYPNGVDGSSTYGAAAAGPPAADPNLEKYHAISSSGSHIAKDDRVKDQMRGAVEAKEMNLFLQRYGGARLRTVFWEIVKGEHPDTFMLRCLRARKWNVDRALAVIGNIAAFRVENDVFQLVKRGEVDIVKTVGGAKVYRNGIAYCWGASKQGFPVCYIEVARHFASNQTQDELKRAIILFQEWLGMLMPPPVSRKIVCFNMTDFGLRNMDWWCVFFLVKTMEMYWPETLERVYVHRAPWFFKPIWTILRPLLDPVVRDKVRFSTTAEELSEYIPPEHLPRSTINGEMEWEYKYPEPEMNENDFITENEERGEELRAEYFALASEFEKSTRALIRTYLQAPPRNIRTFKVHAFGSNPNLSIEEDEPEGADELRAQRDVDATRLRVAWLEWMPYTVAKSKYTRWNVWRPDGTILWTYPQADGSIDYQVFGEGTSLPVLKQSLALIDEAQRMASAALAEERAASMPLSPGSRSARRGRKRDRKPVEKLPGAELHFGDGLPGEGDEDEEHGGGERGAGGGRTSYSYVRPSMDVFGGRLPPPGESSSTEIIAEETEQLRSPALLQAGEINGVAGVGDVPNGRTSHHHQRSESDANGNANGELSSDLDDDVFGPSSFSTQEHHIGGAGGILMNNKGGSNGSASAGASRLRSSSSLATFGVTHRTRMAAGARGGMDAEAYAFGGEAASARAALGAEKAGTGWPSTPSREGGPGRFGGGENQNEDEDEDEEEEERRLEGTKRAGSEDEGQGGGDAVVQQPQPSVTIAEPPARPPRKRAGSRPEHEPTPSQQQQQQQRSSHSASASEETAAGMHEGGVNGQHSADADADAAEADDDVYEDADADADADGEDGLASSDTAVADLASSAAVPLPRKSVDPGTISFIPGLAGEDPIGQVVYDEDGIPH